MTADNAISTNVRTRELSNECIELIEQVCVDNAELINTERFWQTIFEWVKDQRPCKPERDRTPSAMTDDEARQFGRKQIPFGEFAGQRIDDVPLEHLCWYADQRFTDELRRYLRSPRINAEIEHDR